jgi:hypothetical protein
MPMTMPMTMPRRQFLQGGAASLLMGAACKGADSSPPPASPPTSSGQPLDSGALDQAVSTILADTPWSAQFEGYFAQLEETRQEIALTHPRIADALSLVANDIALPLFEGAAALQSADTVSTADVSSMVREQTAVLQGALPSIQAAIANIAPEMDDLDAQVLASSDVLGAAVSDLQTAEVEARAWLGAQGRERSPGANISLLSFQENAAQVFAGTAEMRANLRAALLLAEHEASTARRTAPPGTDCEIFELAVFLLLLVMVLVLVVYVALIIEILALTLFWAIGFAILLTLLMLAIEAYLTLHLSQQWVLMLLCDLVDGAR